MSDYVQAQRDYYRLRCEKAVDALKSRGFDAVVVEDSGSAVEAVLEMVDPGAKVGVPGTVTIRQLGLMEKLQARGNEVVQHWVGGLSAEEMRGLRLEQMTSDVLLTSTNAVTLDGRLINIDGSGNRVAAMVFGPGRVIVVAGANKIAHDAEEGTNRAKRVAGPINALRLGGQAPCTRTGYCVDCSPPVSICNVTVIMDGKPSGTEVTVILVPENLGY